MDKKYCKEIEPATLKDLDPNNTGHENPDLKGIPKEQAGKDKEKCQGIFPHLHKVKFRLR